ncbi:MAG: P-loop NTPase [Bacteroidetes bacterium]|nr:P-loop NTPase [Bacteroidota bacterium]MBU1116610.1 P-loop NTPase [Bacteroidota bacterium]MBU1797727.1 P-loop NTPase [Bacteroidota bacterium]
MIGQAKRLAELVKNETQYFDAKNKTIAVTSGKGGTGKSFFILNLAYQLSLMGKRVLLIDMDSNLANIDVMLNITSEITISDFLQNRVLLKELPTNVRPNMDVIFGDSGRLKLPEKRREIIDYLFLSLQRLENNYDKILIDTGAGVQADGLYILSKVDIITLLINPDPTSVMDGYALTKLFLNEYGKREIGVVVNKCDNKEEGETSFKNINTATTHFLKTSLKYLGTINYDNDVYRSIKEQVIFSEEYPGSELVTQIKNIARNSLLNKSKVL